MLAERGDQDVEAYVQRMTSDPAETTFTSIFKGLRRVKTERTIMHIDEEALRGFFRENPFYQLELTVNDETSPVHGYKRY